MIGSLAEEARLRAGSRLGRAAVIPPPAPYEKTVTSVTASHACGAQHAEPETALTMSRNREVHGAE
jgi:hypothetical protein